MFLSHYRAGTGAVLVETREERRLLRSLLAELPQTAEVRTCAAPGGPMKDARTGRPDNATGLPAAYAWLAGGPGRVLVVYDWHCLVNAPGHWRALIEALPGIRRPKGTEGPDNKAPGSLAVFVGPSWELAPQNPLRGSIPLLQFEAPRRADLASLAEALHPLNGQADAVADALGGLTAESAEQAAAECLAARGRWDSAYLRAARKQLLREAGLEIWPTTPDLGGLGGFRDFAEAELLPWVRDPQLSVRRVLCAGVPGVGKSYCSRWLAHRLGCECARLSVERLKAGIVGASGANLRRALGCIDALAAEAPLVVVIDEVDKIATEGLDGGTSSGMWAELLTWLQEGASQAVIVATLNRLDKLDAAMESRFQARFFFDLPTAHERCAVAGIHYTRLGCEMAEQASLETARNTDGYSSREIAEHVCPSVARRSTRKPTLAVISGVTAGYSPASVTQAEQLKAMRSAAASLRRANDPTDTADPHASRRVML